MNPIADLRRRLDNMLRPGTIFAVDHVRGRCRVKTGNLLTGDLRYFVGRAGAVRHHSAPTLGEQCIVISPSGELATGFVLVGLNSDEFPVPSDNPDLHCIEYADGTLLGYDMGNRELTIIMAAGGSVILQAPVGVQIAGNVNITGTVTVTEDVLANGISLVNHTHNGVETGSGSTGAPQ